MPKFASNPARVGVCENDQSPVFTNHPTIHALLKRWTNRHLHYNEIVFPFFYAALEMSDQQSGYTLW